MNKLVQFRSQINEIDSAIIEFLAKRMQVVSRIGQYKKAHQLSVLDEKRWQELMAKNIQQAQQRGLDVDFVESVYELIHQHALKIQK